MTITAYNSRYSTPVASGPVKRKAFGSIWWDKHSPNCLQGTLTLVLENGRDCVHHKLWEGYRSKNTAASETSLRAALLKIARREAMELDEEAWTDLCARNNP